MIEQEFIYFKRRWLAGKIIRSHQHTLAIPQNIGNHSYGVAQIVRTLYPECSKELLEEALDHDVSELATGDIPHPVKRFKDIGTLINEYEKDFIPQKKLNEEEFLILKTADMMEFFLYIQYEKLMGNKTLLMMEATAIRVLSQLILRLPENVARNANMLMYRAAQGQFQQDERCYGVL